MIGGDDRRERGMVVARRFGGLLRISLAVGFAAAAALAWSAAPASAAPAHTYDLTIQPDPSNPPSSPPAFTLTAACVRKVKGGLEAVFGYENPGPKSRLVLLDPDTIFNDNANVIVRIIKAGPVHAIRIEDLGPQATLFKPGIHPYEFAVRYDASDKISWHVRVPESGGGFGIWLESVSPVEKAQCGRDVPNHFAVAQQVGLSVPGPVITEEGPDGEILAYDLQAGVQSMRATCSAGGQLIEPEVFQGWPAFVNLVDLEESEVPYQVAIEGDSGGIYVFDMSPTLQRPVADIFQPVQWLGPIADVAARCRFGDEVVKSDPFWAEAAGFGEWRPQPLIDGKIFGLEGGQNAPLGSRLR
jgi:hypothetical protein